MLIITIGAILVPITGAVLPSDWPGGPSFADRIA